MMAIVNTAAAPFTPVYNRLVNVIWAVLDPQAIVFDVQIPSALAEPMTEWIYLFGKAEFALGSRWSAACVSAWGNYVLIDKDVELVAGADFQRRLNIDVALDAAIRDTAKRLCKIPPRRIRGRVLGRERRALGNGHVYTRPDQGNQHCRVKRFQIMIVHLVAEPAIPLRICPGHAADLQSRAVRKMMSVHTTRTRLWPNETLLP
ncbi:hypothetical protein ADU59_01460 (plasmid) [Pararhizobium polonicum]|uniref:Uncharacterized protein n=1 Tax=Pararhizobium polonicum TaxID=1612624 RepID=A0A1C7PCH4_9HYPH|nr:hypothetical protein ADU59_01460 [Pararhizobium polonicum]